MIYDVEGTYTVISVRAGSTKLPDSISLDLVLLSIKAFNTYFKILNCSLDLTGAVPHKGKIV